MFDKPADYTAFEKILAEAHERFHYRLVVYCLMPNHWHLVLWPRRDGELSEVLRWITVTHTQRWHAHHHSAGTGPVYQGRFKSFPVQTDEHFLTVARYVERNALRAKLVDRAEEWRWSSLWRRRQGDPTAWLSDWPVGLPRDWVARVNRPETASELDALRLSVRRGRPFGEEGWVRRLCRRCGMESTLRPRGRPKGSRSKTPDPFLLRLQSLEQFRALRQLPLVEGGDGQAPPRAWVKVGTVSDFPRDGGATVKYGKVQIAVFNFASRGQWYACQQMCPHKKAFVLSQGVIGDAGGMPKVACPVHKKAFSLESGKCLSGEEYEVRVFPVKVEAGDVFLELPPTAALDPLLATELGCRMATSSSSIPL